MFLKQTLRTYLIDAFFISVGVVLAAFSLEGLLLPNHFIDGGVTGICLLLNSVTSLSLPLL
ncbi:MAG: YitT family protein, partial [Bacteroidota bacterium]